ncbi:MAG: type I-F CRISPR-associated endoribonuclease Cas6/Csy4 [Deltaproteobacteria bacterium CG07_land_8_20_14_0_80_38_7]|nr:MAG: type I-F CRISPR-associated endoribonuclease Cas6/Csy4 [Deltaproteobacteria bacterium CG07_land_8_20_14_0_80_38_7]
MNYYQEITLLHSADIALNFIWQKVYQQVHLALVENKDADNASAIGIGFPEYDVNKHCLGAKLRLFSQNQAQIQNLDIKRWLVHLTDYVHLTETREIPKSVSQYVRFKRFQTHSNVERLARRRAKRKKEPLEQALKHYKNFDEQLTNLPYINMYSLSEEKRFKLFIDEQIVGEPKSGNFSCYGLSLEGTTLPVF